MNAEPSVLKRLHLAVFRGTPMPLELLPPPPPDAVNDTTVYRVRNSFGVSTRTGRDHTGIPEVVAWVLEENKLCELLDPPASVLVWDVVAARWTWLALNVAQVRDLRGDAIVPIDHRSGRFWPFGRTVYRMQGAFQRSLLEGLEPLARAAETTTAAATEDPPRPEADPPRRRVDRVEKGAKT